MKRLVVVGVAVAAMALAPLLGATASAHEGAPGAPGLVIKERSAKVKADGPGFRIKLRPHELRVRIDEERFGIPEAGFPIQRSQTDFGPLGNVVPPFVCENGTYRIVSGIFDVTERASSAEPRPLPYTPAFAERFPNIITFVGTMDAVVTNQTGEQFRLLMTDLAHEVLTPDSFASTAPIHAFIVDSEGRVRDRASLVGRVNIDRTTGEAVHQIVDRGTCHQTADLDLGPGTDQATVFGPFFVLPFNTTVVTP
ncbi:MAG: hypothetical protein ACRD2C_23470 [Acidimicrobiales bacterium]